MRWGCYHRNVAHPRGGAATLSPKLLGREIRLDIQHHHPKYFGFGIAKPGALVMMARVINVRCNLRTDGVRKGLLRLVHAMLPRSTVNGPGQRAVMWLRGVASRMRFA